MNIEFMEALAEIEKEKGISADKLLEAIQAGLTSAYKRNFGTSQNVTVNINADTGEIKVYAHKNVVESVIEDDRAEILLAEARKKDPRYEIGDVVEVEVTPKDFGRIAAQTAKQVVVQRIREAEREIIYGEFSNREGDIVTGIMQRQDQKNVYIDLGKIEAILGPSEQIPGETYRHGDRLKTYIVEVKKTTKGPQVLVSRTHPGLLKRLFELEVPEIHDGVVELKSVAREAGARSKIAVSSRDENVDPVGACVGPKGFRVQAIVNELKGEKIDIIKWSQDISKYVANSLSPAKVVEVDAREEDKVARVTVPDYQLSLAIGKEGQNARLAAKLTGWKIDIKSESQMEEIRAAMGYADQDEEYIEGDYAEGDYSDEDYIEYDDEWEDNGEEYYDEDYAGEYSEEEYYDEQYADGDNTEAYYDDQEYADNEEYLDENTGPDNDLDQEAVDEYDDEPEEQPLEPIVVEEAEEKGKGKKAKKKGTASKKQAKPKRKKLSTEELSEYLEELKEDK